MTISAQTIPPLECTAAISHHWLVRRRGGEKVLECIAELLPGAPLYTLIYDRVGMGFDRPGGDPARLAEREIHTSMLQRIPGAKKHYQKLLPLMPAAARRMHLPDVDLVVCSDASIAKIMTPHPRSKVVCYCNSPPRYAFEPRIEAEYRAALAWFARPVWDLTIPRVRKADHAAAQRVDQFIGNSRHVAARIRRAYGRDAVVVYPPVDLPATPAAGPREDFYLCVGHHVPYKRLDLAIAACRGLKRRLIVIGDGPSVPWQERDALRNAGIELLGWQSDAAIADHYRRARGLIFPGEEDFGIVPVEAIAHGCPVIAFGVGGACETVIPDLSGIWFDAATAESLCDAIKRFESLKFDVAKMHADTQRFSRPRFLSELRTVIADALTTPRGVRGAP